MIRVDDLTRRYGDVVALAGIGFRVEPGEVLGFLGPNGAGKTTTMKILTGFLAPTSGTATLLGRPLGDTQARAKLGFLPEHPYFYDYLKPIEFLDFYGRLFKLSARERRQQAEALIDRVGLRYAINRPLRKFSKGMVQRICIGQALVHDPDLLIFDEPITGLDPLAINEIRRLILWLKEQGKTVFLSSHDISEVARVCDRISILCTGKLAKSASADEFGGDDRKLEELFEEDLAGVDRLESPLGHLPSPLSGSRRSRRRGHRPRAR